MRAYLLDAGADAVDADALRAFLDRVEELIPTGPGEDGRYGLSDDEFRSILAGRYAPSLARFLAPGDPQRMEHFASAGEPEVVSDQAWQRGRQQLGTLGGGNHFIEIQRIEVVAEAVAREWGLANDRLLAMVHSGSRGFGHQVATDYNEVSRRLAEEREIRWPDRNLASLPLAEPVGRRYLGAMRAAMNFAVWNRQLIGHAVRRAARELLGLAAPPLLYDLLHNYATYEVHAGTRWFIHRKGATRLLPPEHEANPPAYRQTGHPVLVPGSMGTPSYILRGRPEAVETHYSGPHGAGRAMSRTQARKTFSPADLRRQMAGVVVDPATLRQVRDEAPGAYKAIDAVIETGAGYYFDVVARLHPTGVIKGA